MSNEKIRLSKLMSELGLCSRREADVLIEKGRVKVDGEIVDTLGFKCARTSNVEITSSGKKALDQKVTILINKPVGYVSSQPEDGYEPAIRLITNDNQFKNFPKEHGLKSGQLKGLAPAGRLDIDSKGLLILTQDGRVAKKVIDKESPVEKEYLVWVEGQISENRIKKLCHGIKLDDKALKPAKVSQVAPGRLKFILTEGKKRQIRRMCEAVGLKVTSLKRIRIGNIKLGKLPEGQWRFLAKDESF